MLALMCWCCFFALWVACGKAGVAWMRGGLDVWWIGRQSCGEAGRSPKGARKRGGLDVKAAGKKAKVKKRTESGGKGELKLGEAGKRKKGARKRGK